MRTAIQRIRPAECLGRICPEGDLARGQQRTAEAPIIEICRFESLPLPTSRSSRGRTRIPGRSRRRMGMGRSGPTDTRATLTLRKTSRTGTVSLRLTMRCRLLFSPSPQDRMRRMPRSTAHGIPRLSTTRFTAWQQCAGMGSRARSSSLRLSTRTTYVATRTRTTHRCDARSNPSDSKSAAQSPLPTTRSASPTTGSKNHHALAP